MTAWKPPSWDPGGFFRPLDHFVVKVVQRRLADDPRLDARAKLKEAEAFERDHGRAALIEALEAARPDELPPALTKLLAALRTVAA